MSAASAPVVRIEWVDTAKAIGIFLVFFGHVLEQVFDAGNRAALPAFRFIYAFHMPAFFVLSGYVCRPNLPALGIYLRAKLKTRLVPVLFFNAIAVPCHALSAALGEPGVIGFLTDDPLGCALLVARGYSLFNALGWFLVCLFAVELMHFAVSRVSGGQAAWSLPVFGVLGWWIAQPVSAPAWLGGSLNDVWHLRAAVGLAAFYQLGVALRRFGAFGLPRSPRRDGVRGAIALAVLALASGSNAGPWDVLPGRPVVFTNLLQWGDPFAFAAGAMAGSAALMWLARTLPEVAAVGAVGRRTLVLIGPAGLFFHFVNPALARAMGLAESVPAVLAFSFAVSAVSVWASMGLANAFVRWVPGWVGASR
jgi:fucose 4-O-acetylase-like acetyltransferase